jgi:ribonuclease R
VERAHLLRGENNGRVYRLGDRVTVQVIRVDMEKRLIDLGLAEILETVRASSPHRGKPRPKPHGKATPKPERPAARGKRPGPRQRAFHKAARKRR